MIYSAWYCTELKTECPNCEEVIEQLSGNLEAFLEMLDKHEEDCQPDWEKVLNRDLLIEGNRDKENS